jgi:hypothetical protein
VTPSILQLILSFAASKLVPVNSTVVESTTDTAEIVGDDESRASYAH